MVWRAKGGFTKASIWSNPYIFNSAVPGGFFSCHRSIHLRIRMEKPPANSVWDRLPTSTPSSGAIEQQAVVVQEQICSQAFSKHFEDTEYPGPNFCYRWITLLVASMLTFSAYTLLFFIFLCSTFSSFCGLPPLFLRLRTCDIRLACPLAYPCYTSSQSLPLSIAHSHTPTHTHTHTPLSAFYSPDSSPLSMKLPFSSPSPPPRIHVHSIQTLWLYISLRTTPFTHDCLPYFFLIPRM
jgi:hypothetical protein